MPRLPPVTTADLLRVSIMLLLRRSSNRIRGGAPAQRTTARTATPARDRARGVSLIAASGRRHYSQPPWKLQAESHS
jgi:hypothetical protein